MNRDPRALAAALAVKKVTKEDIQRAEDFIHNEDH